MAGGSPMEPWVGEPGSCVGNVGAAATAGGQQGGYRTGQGGTGWQPNQGWPSGQRTEGRLWPSLANGWDAGVDARPCPDSGWPWGAVGPPEIWAPWGTSRSWVSVRLSLVPRRRLGVRAAGRARGCQLAQGCVPVGASEPWELFQFVAGGGWS